MAMIFKTSHTHTTRIKIKTTRKWLGETRPKVFIPSLFGVRANTFDTYLGIQTQLQTSDFYVLYFFANFVSQKYFSCIVNYNFCVYFFCVFFSPRLKNWFSAYPSTYTQYTLCTLHSARTSIHVNNIL